MEHASFNRVGGVVRENAGRHARYELLNLVYIRLIDAHLEKARFLP
jgi:hypothetical protein